MQGPDCPGWSGPGDPHEKSQPPFSFQILCKRTQGPRDIVQALPGKNSIFIPLLYPACCLALTMLCHEPLPHTQPPTTHTQIHMHTSSPAFFLQQQNTVESLGPSLHYFKKPIIRHQSIYVIRKSLPLQSRLSSLHTVITGTKSIFNHFTDWAHQLSRNIVSCLLCESNIWAKTITLLCSTAFQKMPCCLFPMSWTHYSNSILSPKKGGEKNYLPLTYFLSFFFSPFSSLPPLISFCLFHSLPLTWTWRITFKAL